MNMPVWVQIVGTLLPWLGGGYALLTVRQKRRQMDASSTESLAGATQKLGATASEMADDLRQEARDARQEAREVRKEATEARREAADARREMAAVGVQAKALAEELLRIRQAIHEPGMTIDRLRMLIGPARNGASDLR